VRRSVVVDSLGVEELANVVGCVAEGLHPDRKVGGVEALGEEFRVAT
jgi:hypothetical protein